MPLKTITLKSAGAREALRRRYRPRRVRILFVGESPPASGRFFYAENSGLYRALRGVFLKTFPEIKPEEFLTQFTERGCYLVDLCGVPVDNLSSRQRRQTCTASEIRLSRMIRRLQPKIIVTIVRSIAANVVRAQEQAGRTGEHLELPYPGRWKHHRVAFERVLVPVLRRYVTLPNLSSRPK